MDLVTPTKQSQLVLGQLYILKGAGEGVEMLVPQVFRLERIVPHMSLLTDTLVGTLWWSVGLGDRLFGDEIKNHQMALHHVNVGVGEFLSNKHDFHLEAVDRQRAEEYLGSSFLYGEFVA